MLKFISWNVNGLRACLKKGFESSVSGLGADFICLQETKMQEGQAEVDLPAHPYRYFNYAERKGYSGTAVFADREPLSVQRDFDGQSGEGRAIVLEYDRFYLVNLYVPNAQPELRRIDYRMKWEDDLRRELRRLAGEKHVVMCGDLNVAHEEIDLKHPRENRGNAGFSDQERGKMTELLAAGFTDTFRYLHPDARDEYSWWSYRSGARASNAGWRIDYFIVDNALAASGAIKGASIHQEIEGSDHCPVELLLDI